MVQQDLLSTGNITHSLFLTHFMLAVAGFFLGFFHNFLL